MAISAKLLIRVRSTFPSRVLASVLSNTEFESEIWPIGLSPAVMVQKLDMR